MHRGQQPLVIAGVQTVADRAGLSVAGGSGELGDLRQRLVPFRGRGGRYDVS
jgi:hypothetical protein